MGGRYNYLHIRVVAQGTHADTPFKPQRDREARKSTDLPQSSSMGQPNPQQSHIYSTATSKLEIIPVMLIIIS